MSSHATIDGLDITEPGFFLRDDYYEAMAWLRANDPVHRLDDGTWLVSTYDEIREMSRRPDAFSSRRGVLINDPLRASGPRDDMGSIIHLDPPRHADYRKLLNRRFTPRAVGGMEDAVRIATDAVLICDLDDEIGSRCNAAVRDPDLLAALEADEWVGRTVVLTDGGSGVNLVEDEP